MKVLKRIGFYLVVIAVCLIVLSPFLLMILYSIRTSTELYSVHISLFPRNPTLQPYVNALFNYDIGGSNFRTWAINSLIVCGVSTFAAIFIASMCGYALSRFRFRGKQLLWYLILLTQSIPWIILLIPFYMIFSKLGFNDNRAVLGLAYITILIPASTWLFAGFYNSINVDIEDAARIDGCNHWGVYLRIIIPLSITGIAAISLFAFVVGWGDFLFASVFIKTADKWTMPIGLTSFRGQYEIEWAEIMAISTIVTVPIVILFLYLQKHLVNLMSGGVKE